MKHSAFVFAILVWLATSCESVPTPTIAPTAIAERVVTATLMPSDTPTVMPTSTVISISTPTSTAMSTSTPTSTPTQIVTPKPTATPIPKFQWVSLPTTNLSLKSWSPDSWISQKRQGGIIEINDDPIYGQVLKHIVTDNSVVEGGQHIIRIYMGTGDGTFIPAPCNVNMPFWLSKDYVPTPDGWASLLSIFSATPRTDKDYDILATVDLLSRRIPNLNIKKPYSGETFDYERGKTVVSLEQWHILGLSIDSKGMLVMTLDSKAEASGQAHQGGRIGVEMIHAGAYGVGLPNGAFILNGPIEVTCW